MIILVIYARIGYIVIQCALLNERNEENLLFIRTFPAFELSVLDHELLDLQLYDYEGSF